MILQRPENVMAATYRGVGGRASRNWAQAGRATLLRCDRMQKPVEFNSRAPVRGERNESKNV